MKSRSRYFAISIIVFLSIGIFAAGGYLYAAQGENAHDKAAIVEGAKQMMDGNKKVVDIMTKKGIKDADLTASEKMMTEGYNMIAKGETMMTGSTMAEGKAMVTRGANMMMDAEKATMAAVEKHGMTQECSAALNECTTGEKKIKANFQAYGLQGNWEGQQ